ncbi:hypothetical protein, partial [Lishizhenia sp.]|uniref:hypothetical protein n=1 Tax=Lishizhenia sp. TaxID=2497594 RepID=UPI00299DFBCB
MFKVNGSTKSGGRYYMAYEFENWNDEIVHGNIVKDSITDFYKSYFEILYTYSLQCADKIRVTAKYKQKALPEWMSSLLNHDPTLMAKRIKENLHELYFNDSYIREKITCFSYAINKQREILE